MSPGIVPCLRSWGSAVDEACVSWTRGRPIHYGALVMGKLCRSSYVCVALYIPNSLCFIMHVWGAQPGSGGLLWLRPWALLRQHHLDSLLPQLRR